MKRREFAGSIIAASAAVVVPRANPGGCDFTPRRR